MESQVRVYTSNTSYMTKAGPKDRTTHRTYKAKTNRIYRKEDHYDSVVMLIHKGYTIAEIKRELDIGDYTLAKYLFKMVQHK